MYECAPREFALLAGPLSLECRDASRESVSQPSAGWAGLAFDLHRGSRTDSPGACVLTRPTGVGRAIATYDMLNEGRDEWLAAARRLA